MDMTCLETGLLHDVVEDTSATIEEIRKNFGEEVARCVDGVTKLSKLDLASREERQAESVRKMLLAMVNDIRVILVKLADRLHNCARWGRCRARSRSASHRKPSRSTRPSRTGWGWEKSAENWRIWRFSTWIPKRPRSSSRNSRRRTNRTKSSSRKSSIRWKSTWRREGIPARVETRLKRAYSVYQKLKRQKITLDQVYDLLAVRIITDSVKNCYAALGVIHNEWHPIPGRIKDFIAIPRPNLYQSLHTSVMGPGGRHFEVQIRTEEMHRLAEEGIAAHWKYKEGRKGPAQAGDDQRIAWLRQLVEWQSDMHDPGEFMSTLKVDLYPEEVYTFTPHGESDRAAARRDAHRFRLRDPLRRRQSLRRRKGERPHRTAEIRLCATAMWSKSSPRPAICRAKTGWRWSRPPRRATRSSTSSIRRSAPKPSKSGKNTCERGSAAAGCQDGRITKAQLESVASDYGYGKMEDLHAALGYGKFSPRQILQKLPRTRCCPEPAPEPPAPSHTAVPAGRARTWSSR